MKYLFIILSLLLLSCNEINHSYDVKVIYNDSSTEVLTIRTSDEYNMYLNESGCLYIHGYGNARCGVRTYTIVKVHD